MDGQLIIAQLKNRDEAGYIALIDRYTRYVAAVITGLAKGALPAEDMEEIAADVFFSVWQGAARLREDAPLKPYIAQAARNATISRLRKAGREAVPLEEDLLHMSRADEPDEVTLRREQQESLTGAVADMGEPDRELFIRFYYFGEPLTAIAPKIGLTDGAVRTRLHRARQKLKAMLKERGYHDEP